MVVDGGGRTPLVTRVVVVGRGHLGVCHHVGWGVVRIRTPQNWAR